ncbi:winged helix-turn-helix transcriptional regulator [Nitriliruptoraceae bacterium ZYF776]|nr:winged helix-turn-helix transcriptional regulator [Profundirhabdus halotolerans]
MAVTFRLPGPRSVDLLGFGWSPLFESVLAMAVVARPKRTPMHLPWVRRCRDLLPSDLHAEVVATTRAFDGAVPGIFEVGLLGDSPAFDDELAAFRELDPALVAYELSVVLGGYSCGPVDGRGPHLVDDPAYRDEVVAAADAAGEDRGRLARATLADPEGTRERLARLLARFWEAAFVDEWARISPRIEAEVTDGARALVTGGAAGLVDGLLPEGRFDADLPAIVVDRPWDGVCDVAERGGMLFVPTVYGWPRVLVELNEPWPVAVFLPLRDLRQPEVPHASDHVVAEGLRALGDETRLQIARLVAEQPRSTKELAQLLRLSESAVSRHLKLLDAAGVVSKARDGYFVLYQLRVERLGELGGALRRTLGLAPSSAGPVPALPVAPTRPEPR